MNIPLAYAVGLAVLVLARATFFVPPGSGSLWVALLALPLVLLPALALAWAQRRRARRPGDRLGRLLERLSPGLLPAAYLVLLVPGGWLDLCDRWAGASYVASLLLLLLPLLIGEVTRLCVESRAFDAAGDIDGRELRMRLALVAIVTLPWAALSVVGDLLQGDRAAYVFFAGTGMGLTLGAIAFVLVLVLVLPLVFRFVFGLSPRLPEPLGAELRATAAALGFPGRCVLWWDSGMRTVNALLVGPLPWPRYLVLTDGLVAALDLHALRGVVAHEVGHAQAGHPAMLLGLFVVAPLLLAHLPQQMQVDQVGGVWAVVATGVVLLVGWRVLRAVAHRFEHEADVLSAIALGGAEPCIRALQRVGQVVQQEPERSSLLHPSERARVDLLRRFATEPAFAARFTLRGVRLRYGIVVVLGLSLLGAMWNWSVTWPLERAATLYLTGDLAGARAQVEEVGTQVPASQWQWWQTLREEIDAATTIAGDGGPWDELWPELAEGGWQRGVETLLRDGPALARPWFALAALGPSPSALRRSLLLFCEAAADGDVERMGALQAHVRELGCPPELMPVFPP
ncbi:MAG: M48 family metalloprotease [Planctomycetota bacterium]